MKTDYGAGIEGELNPNGCARLVAAIVQHALTYGIGYESSDSTQNTAARLNRRADVVGKFAKSPIVDHFADAYGYDSVRVRSALLRRSGAIREEAAALLKEPEPPKP